MSNINSKRQGPSPHWPAIPDRAGQMALSGDHLGLPGSGADKDWRRPARRVLRHKALHRLPAGRSANRPPAKGRRKLRRTAADPALKADGMRLAPWTTYRWIGKRACHKMRLVCGTWAGCILLFQVSYRCPCCHIRLVLLVPLRRSMACFVFNASTAWSCSFITFH